MLFLRLFPCSCPLQHRHFIVFFLHWFLKKKENFSARLAIGRFINNIILCFRIVKRISRSPYSFKHISYSISCFKITSSSQPRSHSFVNFHTLFFTCCPYTHSYALHFDKFQAFWNYYSKFFFYNPYVLLAVNLLCIYNICVCLFVCIYRIQFK